MEFNYKGYEISIKEEIEASRYKIEEKYDKVIILQEDDGFCKYLLVTVNKGTVSYNVMLIASWYTPTEPVELFAALHKKGIVLMLNDVVCIFNPETLEIEDKRIIEPLLTMLGIYPYKDEYILHGEMEICRMSADLEIKWIYSGYDIFVTQTGEHSAIELKDDRICISDFYDNYYEINYDGEEIFKRITPINDVHARKKIPLKEQISLNYELYEVLAKDKVDLAEVERLLDKGADPLGYYEENNWSDTPYLEFIVDCQGTDYDDLPKIRQLPDLTKLFLEYGMNVENVVFDVMHPFTWLRHSSGITTLEIFIKNGMTPDFADGIIWDMMGDIAQFESPDDDALRLEYASKMMMLVAAYYREHLDKCEFIKNFIEIENNDQNMLECFKDWRRYSHQIIIEDTLEWDQWDRTKIRIFDCDIGKEVWKYSFATQKFRALI